MKTVSYLKQPDSMECGATCLRMITQFYGKEYSAETMHQLCLVTREGVSMLGSTLYAAWVFLFLKKCRLLDYTSFEQHARNQSKTMQLLNGMQQFSLRWWRSECGAVIQDGYIFSESIARNIAVDDEDIDKARLLLAARIANIEEFIGQMPPFLIRWGNTILAVILALLATCLTYLYL